MASYVNRARPRLLSVRRSGIAGYIRRFAGTPVRVPALGLVERGKVTGVQTGMDRAAVEAMVGKPHSVMAIQGADEPMETLIYNLEDKGTARVRMVNGKVVSVQFD